MAIRALKRDVQQKVGIWILTNRIRVEENEVSQSFQVTILEGANQNHAHDSQQAVRKSIQPDRRISENHDVQQKDPFFCNQPTRKLGSLLVKNLLHIHEVQQMQTIT